MSSPVVETGELLARIRKAGWRTKDTGLRVKVYPPVGPIIVLSRFPKEHRAVRNAAALLQAAGLDIRSR